MLNLCLIQINKNNKKLTGDFSQWKQKVKYPPENAAFSGPHWGLVFLQTKAGLKKHPPVENLACCSVNGKVWGESVATLRCQQGVWLCMRQLCVWGSLFRFRTQSNATTSFVDRIAAAANRWVFCIVAHWPQRITSRWLLPYSSAWFKYDSLFYQFMVSDQHMRIRNKSCEC